MDEKEFAKKLGEITVECCEEFSTNAIICILDVLIKLEGLNKEERLILLTSMKEVFCENLKSQSDDIS